MIGIPWIECGLTWDAFEIGSINRLRGVCDDCEAFRWEAIVTRYRRLVEIP